MRCETCHGGRNIVNPALPISGRMLAFDFPGPPKLIPCPDCGGTGFSHCCEGDRACPEPDPGDAA